MINWKNLFSALFSTGPSNKTGALPDPRSDAEKAKDWLHEERVMAAAPVNAFGYKKITTSPYPYLNQHFTLSCVLHGIGLAAAIERQNDTGVYVEPAPIFGYRQRSNYPEGGTWPPEGFEIIRTKGLPPMSSLFTPMTEAQANAVVITQQERNEAAIYKGASYFMFGTPNDIDAIANIAAQGHGVPLCLFANNNEWSREYPVVSIPNLDRTKAEINHEVCVLPYSGFVENGVRYVAIQDSAWFGGFKLRYLSEQFIAARIYSAGYWDTVATVGGGPRPVYTFKNILKVGAQGEEVRNMQLLLISENLLPSDCATGLFGGLTLAGVHAFQNKYSDEILKSSGLTAPTDIWGNGCISKANALCIR